MARVVAVARTRHSLTKSRPAEDGKKEKWGGGTSGTLRMLDLELKGSFFFFSAADQGSSCGSQNNFE